MLATPDPFLGALRYEVVLGAELDQDGVEATLREGVLRMRVPKSSTGTAGTLK
ncbi:Hsp20/alpha crystallin family protein [Kribbella steppae]|uniref:Hsp20/alpha crystallin family protein n=1 Tax=Kribbella steppae TaxID=2512223 RepID=UPI0010496F8B|nr:Hsp20/alpha crystallin family protein [Kribbella steppae]